MLMMVRVVVVVGVRTGSRVDEEHLMTSCELYGDIREKYDDLSQDSQMVNFFREVLKRTSFVCLLLKGINSLPPSVY